MELLSYDAGLGPRFGVLKGERAEVIAGGPDALASLTALVDRAEPSHRLSDVRLLCPVPQPGKYLAIGMNFRKHLEEAQALGEVRT